MYAIRSYYVSRIGVQTASFVAVIGAAGLAIGLALQGSLSNFAAGVLIIMFRPIKAGEFVEVAGTSRITSYNVCYTKLLRYLGYVSLCHSNHML